MVSYDKVFVSRVFSNVADFHLSGYIYFSKLQMLKLGTITSSTTLTNSANKPKTRYAMHSNSAKFNLYPYVVSHVRIEGMN